MGHYQFPWRKDATSEKMWRSFPNLAQIDLNFADSTKDPTRIKVEVTYKEPSDTSEDPYHECACLSSTLTDDSVRFSTGSCSEEHYEFNGAPEHNVGRKGKPADSFKGVLIYSRKGIEVCRMPVRFEWLEGC